MLRSNTLMAFVATRDADRAKPFYRDVLGLPLVSDDGFAVVFDAAGTMLRMQKVESFTPHPFTSLGWHVEDLTSTMKELARAGVRFERFEGMPQDELGAWTSPSAARIAWFKDPDGNVLSLTELDATP